jgi:hypothetical protein
MSPAVSRGVGARARRASDRSGRSSRSRSAPARLGSPREARSQSWAPRSGPRGPRFLSDSLSSSLSQIYLPDSDTNRQLRGRRGGRRSRSRGDNGDLRLSPWARAVERDPFPAGTTGDWYAEGMGPMKTQELKRIRSADPELPAMTATRACSAPRRAPHTNVLLHLRGWSRSAGSSHEDWTNSPRPPLTGTHRIGFLTSVDAAPEVVDRTSRSERYASSRSVSSFGRLRAMQ